jgi:hypothetical protein
MRAASSPSSSRAPSPDDALARTAARVPVARVIIITAALARTRARARLVVARAATVADADADTDGVVTVVVVAGIIVAAAVARRRRVPPLNRGSWAHGEHSEGLALESGLVNNVSYPKLSS